MGRTKSDNRLLSIAAGFSSRWDHHTGGTKTYTPRTGESVVLHRIIINTTSASAIIIRDSAVGVIATIAASTAAGDISYGITCRGNLVIENPGNSDLTVVFSDD